MSETTIVLLWALPVILNISAHSPHPRHCQASRSPGDLGAACPPAQPSCCFTCGTFPEILLSLPAQAWPQTIYHQPPHWALVASAMPQTVNQLPSAQDRGVFEVSLLPSAPSGALKLFVLIWGLHRVVLRVYSLLCIPGSLLGDSYVMSGIRPGSVTGKASALLIVLAFQPLG